MQPPIRPITWSLLLLLASLVACGGGQTQAGVCVPGQSAACVCGGGSQGVQQCQADGTYGGCSCTAGPLQYGDAGAPGDASAPQPSADQGTTQPQPEPPPEPPLEKPQPEPEPPPQPEPPKPQPEPCPTCLEVCAGQAQPAHCPKKACECLPICKPFNVAHATSQVICAQTIGALAQACTAFGCSWNGPTGCALGGSPSSATAFGAEGRCCCLGVAKCSGHAFNIADGSSEAGCNQTVNAWSQICKDYGCSWSGATQCAIGGSPSSPSLFGAQGQCM